MRPASAYECVHAGDVGGAGGVRTRDLLDAIEARSQLRHGPTEEHNCLTFITPHREGVKQLADLVVDE